MSDSTCSTETCERKVYYRGKCHKHYVRVGRPQPRPCSIDGCEKTARCQELCDMHYTRLRRHGEPTAIMNADRELSDSERLERYGWTITELGCWEFNGPTRHGYGQISVRGNRSAIASRVAYEAWIGPISEDLFVCHRCDNPICINPSHLFLGTHDENMDDCKSKMRHMHGERAWKAKVTADEAATIRDLYATGRYTQAQIGRMYGLRQTGVSAIVRRVNWKHVA
jgi:hypothetical protein